jgi:hypothetical protein
MATEPAEKLHGSLPGLQLEHDIPHDIACNKEYGKMLQSRSRIFVSALLWLRVPVELSVYKMFQKV